MSKGARYFLYVFSVIGALVFANNRFSTCDDLANNLIKKEQPITNKELRIIYVIREANTLCRPCMRYEEFKMMSFPSLFLVAADFSNNDINNFRDAFSITDEIRRIDSS